MEVESADVIREQLGLDIILPEDAQDVTYSIISDEIAQATFLMDGSNYTYRIKKSGSFEDISGVFDSFETTKEMTWVDYPYTLSYNEGGAGLSTWYDQSTAASYTLYIDSEATETTLVNMTQALIPAGW